MNYNFFFSSSHTITKEQWRTCSNIFWKASMNDLKMQIHITKQREVERPKQSHRQGAKYSCRISHWIATATLCIRKWKERGSPNSNLVRWPNSLKKMMASEPNTPDVSMAMGTKWWLVIREEYFCFFLRSASWATAPASLVASVMWDGANVSRYVASHTRTRPPFHGTIVANLSIQKFNLTR